MKHWSWEDWVMALLILALLVLAFCLGKSDPGPGCGRQPSRAEMIQTGGTAPKPQSDQ